MRKYCIRKRPDYESIICSMIDSNLENDSAYRRKLRNLFEAIVETRKFGLDTVTSRVLVEGGLSTTLHSIMHMKQTSLKKRIVFPSDFISEVCARRTRDAIMWNYEQALV